MADSGGLPSTHVDKCEACGRELAVDETFTEHLVGVHLTSEGMCDICGGDSEDFIEHFKIHLKSNQFQADTLTPMVSIKAEFIDKEIDVNENCIYDMNSRTNINVEENPKTEVETETIVATKIEEEEEFQKLVKCVAEHSLPCNEQDTSQFTCYICKKTFRQVSQHVALYHCNITYPCSLCDKFTGNRKEMKKHVASEHGVEKNQGKGEYCFECNKKVTKISEHIKRVHLQLKQHYCTLCEKGFYDKRDFEQHVHTSNSHGHKEEVCGECGLSVKNLQKHIKDVHTIKPPSQLCPECGKSVGYVREHVKAVHGKVKNFSCPICPLKTYKKGTLNRHMAVHDKYSAMNKPYPHTSRKPEYSPDNLGKPTEKDISMSRRKALKLSIHTHEI